MQGLDDWHEGEEALELLVAPLGDLFVFIVIVIMNSHDSNYLI